MKHLLLALIAIAGFTFSYDSFGQSVYYVKSDGSGNGSNWANASGDLQSIIEIAEAGDQIWVAAGTYKPSSLPGATGTLTGRDVSFVLKSGVEIYGGFSGTETQLSDRDVVNNLSILSGDIGVLNDSTDNAYHVVMSVKNSSETLLDGFTITGGNANASGSVSIEGINAVRSSGGGIYANLSEAVFRNVTVRNNRCSGGPDGTGFNGNGGGIYAFVSKLTIENSRISENVSEKSGASAGGTSGGMFAFASAATAGKLTLKNVIFENNRSDATGGGMLIQTNMEADFENVQFIKNKASGSGGALYVSAVQAQFHDIQFIENEAIGSAGAMYVSGGTAAGFKDLILNGAVFSSNTATGAGGAVYVSSYTNYHVNNALFSDNVSGSAGGGMFLFSGGGTAAPNDNAVISNSIFYNNVSNGETLGGGGIFVSNGTQPTIVNNTFYGNHARYGGGAMGIFSNASVKAEIVNNIFYTNSTDGTDQDFYVGALATADLANSITQGQGTNGVNGVKVDVDPLFASVDPVSSLFLRLSEASPAVDAGDNDKIPAGVTTDLGGHARIVNGTVDMGAYEYFSPSPVTLSSFTASKGKNEVYLNWNTSSEQNTDYFDVESGDNGVTFSKIGTVGSSGNSNTERSYNFTDLRPRNGSNYYRLKMVDKDGAFSYSKVVSVQMQIGNWKLSPNPATTIVELQGPFSRGEQALIRIVNNNGQEVYRKTAVSENNKVQINIQKLPAGIYHLQMNLNGQKHGWSFLKN